MRALVLVASAVFAGRCFGLAASQAWVEQFVSNYVARAPASVEASVVTAHSSGAVVATTAVGDGTEMRLELPDFSDAALMATNCTDAAVLRGVTNGCLFVWDGAGAYVCPAGAVSCTATNLVWDGMGSVRGSDGLDGFAGWFDVRGTLVQPGTSLSVTNGLAEAER